MRKLLILIVLLGLAWSGWWLAAQQGITRGLDVWLSDRAAEGWQAEAEISTTGYPLDLNTTLTNLALTDPDTGLSWRAPEFSFSAAAYAPTKVTATWPATQSIASPFERIEVASTTMEGFLGLVPGPNLELDASDITLAEVNLTASTGWTASLESGRLNTARVPDRPLAHDIGFSAFNLAPAQSLLRILDPAGLLPTEITEMTVSTRIGFDAPWDRRAIEDRRPQITDLDLGALTAKWGDMALEAAGSITVDPEGTPEGRITVRATNWRDMLSIAQASGALPETLVPTVESALELLAGLSGNPRTIDAPLSFQNGFVSLGPLPLGKAPKIILR